MVKTSIADHTKLSLLEAAGTLIAEQGNVDAVTVRDIAERANVNPAMIKYYFGDKASLLSALMDYVIMPSQHLPISYYYQQNKTLLNTKDGQVIFINGLIDTFCHYFSPEELSGFRRHLVYQILRRTNALDDDFISRFFIREVKVFAIVHEKITGNNDPDRIYNWFLSIFIPLAIRLSRSEHKFDLNQKLNLSEHFNARMIFFCKQQLLTGLGLIRPDHLNF